MSFKIGDGVETTFGPFEAQRKRELDVRKAKKEGARFFIGNAAAYMHTEEAYVIVGFERGGVRLRGFVPLVSRKFLRLSNFPVYR